MQKETFTRDEFYMLVWQTPVSHLLKKYVLKQHEFQNLCKKFDIPLPGIGYWTKIRSKKSVQRKLLPPSTNVEEIALTLRSAQDTPRKLSGESTIFQVPEKLKKPHHYTLETKRLWEDLKIKRHSYDRTIPHFSIRVEPASEKRALLFMDTFAKIIDKRGHHLEYKYYRSYAIMYGVEIELDLREAGKRIPKPDSYPAFVLEYTGELVLMTGKYSINREWRDGKIKLEGMLEKIITWMESRAREYADWQEKSRLAQFEREREKEIQENVAALQQQELDCFKKLLDDSKKYHEAITLRKYIAAVQSKAADEHSAELQQWIQWASKKADMLDPLTKNDF